jgi:hypothetical protein
MNGAMSTTKEKEVIWEENEYTTPKKNNASPSMKDECDTMKKTKGRNANALSIDITEINPYYQPKIQSHRNKSINYINTVLKNKYNKLTPLKFLGYIKLKRGWASVFRCQCDCGTIINVLGSKLTGKNPKNMRQTCGCIELGHKNPMFKGCGEISLEKWAIIKSSAKKRNIPFNITIQQIWELFLNQNRKCALTGEILSFNISQRQRNGTASLDRIDSSKGYSIDNIQWVHKDINFMKRVLSQEKFFEWCRKIVINNNLL